MYGGWWCTWAHVSAEGIRRHRTWSWSFNQTRILDKSSKHSSPEPIRTSLITIPNQNWENDQPDPTLTGTVYVHRSLAYTPVLSVKHTWEEWGQAWGSVNLSFVPFTDAVTINKFLCSVLLVSLLAYREEVTKPNLLGLLEKGFCYQNCYRYYLTFLEKSYFSSHWKNKFPTISIASSPQRMLNVSFLFLISLPIFHPLSPFCHISFPGFTQIYINVLILFCR